jgi:hypothetical protein
MAGLFGTAEAVPFPFVLVLKFERVLPWRAAPERIPHMPLIQSNDRSFDPEVR